MDATDRKIIALLAENARRSFSEIGKVISLSPAATKRRVDRLIALGALEGFTAIINYSALGWETEALVELFYAPGTSRDSIVSSLKEHPEVLEAWSVTGDADAIVRVRTESIEDLERLFVALQRGGLVQRTHSQVVMSRLITRPSAGAGPRSTSA